MRHIGEKFAFNLIGARGFERGFFGFEGFFLEIAEKLFALLIETKTINTNPELIQTCININ